MGKGGGEKKVVVVVVTRSQHSIVIPEYYWGNKIQHGKKPAIACLAILQNFMIEFCTYVGN